MKLSQIVRAAGLVAGALALSACGLDYATTQPTGSEQQTQEQTATSTPEAPQTPEAAEQGTPLVVEIGEKEGFTEFLQTSEGKPVYRFNNDTNNPATSTCTGGCAEVWQPVPADKVTAVLGVDQALVGSLERPDGSGNQLTVKDWPAYTFTGDTKPGDLTGHGQNGAWFAMAPDGTTAKTAEEAAAQKSGGTVVTDTKTGKFTTTIMVNGEGRTMYVFDQDPPNEGVSTCEDNAECDKAWPPVLADNGLQVVEDCVDPDLISTFTRKDGGKQVAIDGRLLYYFDGDKAAGDTNGHGVGSVWWVATGDGSVAETVG